MAEYALYVESGPRQRKTMVHVLDLLGCVAQGPTTEAALAATPEAIRSYRRFLRRHDGSAETDSPFTVAVFEHVTQGPWLGNGDPTPGFGLDFQPLTVKDLGVYLGRLDWLLVDFLALIRDVPTERLLAEPDGRGRSPRRIAEHVAEAHAAYLRYLVGKVDGLVDALKAVERGPESLPDALTRLSQISRSRLEATTEVERRQSVAHGQVTWTARRALRRMLEHGWEHLMELTARSGRP